MECKFSKSEKKVLSQIRGWLGDCDKPYSFWFVRDHNGLAVNWEGGLELSMKHEFRNQYTIPGKGKKVIKNWG